MCRDVKALSVGLRVVEGSCHLRSIHNRVGGVVVMRVRFAEWK